MNDTVNIPDRMDPLDISLTKEIVTHAIKNFVMSVRMK